PNVFYIETSWRGRTLRAKYAIVSLSQLRRAVSPRAFHSYFWARFAQPVRLAHVRDAGVRAFVVAGLVDAMTTLATRVGGLLGDRFTTAEFWTRPFQAPCAGERRAGGADRARLVYDADRARYDGLTARALEAAGFAVEAMADGRVSVPAPSRARRSSAV